MFNERIVYPGHPLTLALIITDVYPSLAEAEQKALGSREVPGAGGNVHSALDFLRRAMAGNIDAAIEHANAAWAYCDGQRTAQPERWRNGQAQADRVMDELRRGLERWRGKQSGIESRSKPGDVAVTGIVPGDVVQHIGSLRHGRVVEIGKTCRDDTIGYRMKVDGDDPSFEVWWNSSVVRKIEP